MSGRWFGEGKVLQRMSLVGAWGSQSHAVSTVLRPGLRQCTVLSRPFFCFCVFVSYVCVGYLVFFFCVFVSYVCVGYLVFFFCVFVSYVCVGYLVFFFCVFVSYVCVGYLVFFFCVFVSGIHKERCSKMIPKWSQIYLSSPIWGGPK
jgi:hypothetical protein